MPVAFRNPTLANMNFINCFDIPIETEDEVIRRGLVPLKRVKEEATRGFSSPIRGQATQQVMKREKYNTGRATAMNYKLQTKKQAQVKKGNKSNELLLFTTTSNT